MTPRDIRRRLRQYEAELRALVAGLESDVQAGRALQPALRARLQAFGERLNDDLLQLYDRQRRGGLSAAEVELLLPVVAEVRDLLRGVGASRTADAAAKRLRNAAATVARC